MRLNSKCARTALRPAITTAFSLIALHAQAVPSYARQTGQDCVACHIGGFGPQLTPFGIKFKLGGYVDSDGKDGKVPLSAMVVAEYNRYKEPDANGNLVTSSSLGVAESSVFLAGKLSDHIGSFVQVTNSGTEHITAIDQADLRVTTTMDVGMRKEALLGLSINNNPTVQDPFNTLSVWGFPYTSSEHDGMSYPGTDLVSASAGQRVIGTSAYALLNDSIYAELGLYNTLSPAIQSRLGLGQTDGEAFGRINNAPYWRLGYMQDLRTSAWSVGLLGFNGDIKDRLSGDSMNRFRDLGIDASYQFLGNRQHVVTVNASYLKEHTTVADDAGDISNSTKDFRLAASYHFMNTYGASLAYVKASSQDHSTDNRGYIYQLDWTPWGKESSWAAPWANLRLGLQYVSFKADAETEANGGKPGDKNNMRVFAWTSF